MLRTVVSALVAHTILVRCNSDVLISLACLTDASDSPGHGIIGTTSRRDLEGLRSSRQRVEEHSIRLCSAGYPAGIPTSFVNPLG